MQRMPIAKQIRVGKKQAKNRMFGTCYPIPGENERRKCPLLGSAWFDVNLPADANEAEHQQEKHRLAIEREAYIEAYREETQRLLIKNPNLKLI